MMMSRTKKILLILGVAETVGFAWYVKWTHDEYRRTRPPLTFPKFMLLRSFPLHTLSNWAGWASNLQIPVLLRRPLYRFYATIYGCKLNECAPLADFPTFASFFARPLLPGLRVPDPDAPMLSPCDGRLLQVGTVSDITSPEQHYFQPIKGVHYNLVDLIGPDASAQLVMGSSIWHRFLAWSRQAIPQQQKQLHYATIYLAPGDYHRFHAPCDLRITRCIQVPGERAPVRPALLRTLLPEALRLNCRAIISGSGPTGPVCIVPIGSLNVGSISVVAGEGARIARGNELGSFAMGSTVVLLFTTDGPVKWAVHPGDCVQVGQPLALP